MSANRGSDSELDRILRRTIALRQLQREIRGEDHDDEAGPAGEDSGYRYDPVATTRMKLLTN